MAAQPGCGSRNGKEIALSMEWTVSNHKEVIIGGVQDTRHKKNLEESESRAF